MDAPRVRPGPGQVGGMPNRSRGRRGGRSTLGPGPARAECCPGGWESSGWISPRHAPVSVARSSMNVLNRSRSPSTRRDTTPRMSPIFSMKLLGSYSRASVNRVRSASIGANTTTPEFTAPRVCRQAMDWSGSWWTISAVHSSVFPPIRAFQLRVRSSSWTTSSTPSMKRGKSSNCVHWS